MKTRIPSLFCIILVSLSVLLDSCKKADTSPPVVTLIGGNVNLYIGQAYVEQGATAEDTQDGNLTGNIEITGAPTGSLSGVYTVKYTVSDAAGNEGSAERTVVISNHAQSLVGKYDVWDSAGIGAPNAGTVTLYTDSITMSTSTDNRIVVRSFGSYINGAVYMDVINNMTSLNIPSQTLTCGSPAASRNFISWPTPSPSISTTNPITITFTFQEILNSTTFYKYERYVKQ